MATEGLPGPGPRILAAVPMRVRGREGAADAEPAPAHRSTPVPSLQDRAERRSGTASAVMANFPCCTTPRTVSALKSTGRLPSLQRRTRPRSRSAIASCHRDASGASQPALSLTMHAPHRWRSSKQTEVSRKHGARWAPSVVKRRTGVPAGRACGRWHAGPSMVDPMPGPAAPAARKGTRSQAARLRARQESQALRKRPAACPASRNPPLSPPPGFPCVRSR